MLIPPNEITSGANRSAGGGRIVLLLAAIVALIMTGYGVVYPVLPSRLLELGAGVDALGLMIIVFAGAQFLLAPFMGSLGDRFGRRPLLLLALVGFGVTNLMLVLANSIGALVAIRLVEGILTAGLLPGALAMVGDLAPPERRGHWSGAIMGGLSLGLAIGPTLGGLLYQSWGFAAPFVVSSAMALPSLVLILVWVPETRPTAQPSTAPPSGEAQPGRRLFDSLPRPLRGLIVLLVLDFLGVFVFAFIEPPFAFYVYETLRFSPTQFGLIIGVYGLSTVVAQAATGQISDRIGRRAPIVVGFLLNVGFYLSLVVWPDFGTILVTSAVAGLGTALVNPALSAAYLDIADEAHRSRVFGLKESAASLGGLAGPLLVALTAHWISPEQTFLIAATLPVVAAILGQLALVDRRADPEP